jgi:hypothetical protein
VFRGAIMVEFSSVSVKYLWPTHAESQHSTKVLALFNSDC